MANQEMPIFTRTYDFLTWLLPATNNFPRAQRNSATKRLLDAAFDLRERLEEANIRKGPARQERLERADASSEVGLGQGNFLSLKPLRDQVRLRPHPSPASRI